MDPTQTRGKRIVKLKNAKMPLGTKVGFISKLITLNTTQGKEFIVLISTHKVPNTTKQKLTKQYWQQLVERKQGQYLVLDLALQRLWEEVSLL
jgi:hypothetical protein